MIEVNFDKVQQAFVTNGVNNAIRESQGLVLTENMICDYNAVVILNHIKTVYDEELDDAQRNNISIIYNRLIV